MHPPDPEGSVVYNSTNQQAVLIGVSGQRTTLEGVEEKRIQTSYLEPRLLPRAPIGYDCLEALFLNQVDLQTLDADQQSAIVSWVRAGGSLLVAPGGSAIPSAGPLVAALPCRIGPVIGVDLSPQFIQQSGLQQRFAHMAGRALISTVPAEIVVRRHRVSMHRCQRLRPSIG